MIDAVAESTPGDEAQPAATYTLKDSLRFAGLLAVLDGFCLGQFGFAVLLAGWTLLVRVPMIFVAWSDRPLRAFRIRKVAIYLLAVVVIMGVFMFNRQLGTRRADALVAAVQAYSARHGQFPEKLEQLVPDFMAAIPLARYTLVANDFSYRVTPEGRHVLGWTIMPPMARRAYTFEDKAWKDAD